MNANFLTCGHLRLSAAKTCPILSATMSLEFALQYACPLRANYSERHLREWGRLSSLHAQLTTSDTTAPSIDNLRWVKTASADIEGMQKARTVCSECPADLP